jgi:hypothetical protein
MRGKILTVLAAALLPALFAAVSAGAQDASGPSAFFPQNQYEFSQVLDGDKVVHDFVIQNRGTATLNVERVKTG